MNAADLATRAAAGDFSPEVAEWLQRGMAAHLAGQPLEQSLGLCDSARMRARNQHLTAAAARIDAGRGVPPHRLAGELELAINRFMSSRRTSGDKAVDQCLQAAAATGARPICTQRALYDLLKL